MGTDHKLTLAYSKEENAMVENANKRVQEYLRDIMFERRIINKWSIALPIVQRILMTDRNEVTGMTPAEMLFGNAVDLDRGIFLPNAPVDEEGKEIRLSEWAANVLETQRDLLDIAAKRQRKRDHNRLIQEHDAEETDFPVGSFVLVSYPQTGMGRKPPTKLHPRLKGPYQVVNKRKDKYTLRNLLTNSMEDFHITSLHPYYQNAQFISPQEVILRDKDEFQIETVLAHRGDTTKLSSLQFQVKWLGYDDSVNSWEPWKTIRATTQLHNYLISQNLQNLIPKAFRHEYPQVFTQRRADIPVEPIQGFAQPAMPARKGPRQVRNANKRRTKKVRFQRNVNVII
jgi:hypothetical protein